MAVLPSIPGLKATIKVNGVEAQEYDSPSDESSYDMTPEDFHLPPDHDHRSLPYVVKYIEAIPGAPYEFNVAKEQVFRQRSHHIAVEFYTDGRGLYWAHDYCGTNEQLLNRPWNKSVASSWSGDPKNGYQRHSFQFASLNIVEAEQVSSKDIQEQITMAKNYGVLKVSFFHMRYSDVEIERRGRDGSSPFAAHGQGIAEKALKGKSTDCYTTYTITPMAPPSRTRLKDNYEDSKRRPFAVFEFRYRSKEGLIREGIIPRPSIQDEVKAMSEDQVRERLAALLEHRERSGSANGTDAPTEGGDSTRGMKREAKPMTGDDFTSRYKTRRLENGSIEVDLCGIKSDPSAMPDDDFITRYKARRLDGGGIEVDLTDD